MFDSSVVRGERISFSLNQVIAGWTEGLQLMTPGETRRLWIPEALAYKARAQHARTRARNCPRHHSRSAHTGHARAPQGHACV
jgi:hypothetical protein